MPFGVGPTPPRCYVVCPYDSKQGLGKSLLSKLRKDTGMVTTSAQVTDKKKKTEKKRGGKGRVEEEEKKEERE